MSDKILKVTCECKDYLNLDDLTEFQGNLKQRSDSDVDKIIKSIKKYGFSFPFFVWKHDNINHCLDGHGRMLAINKLREQGFQIPPLPVVYVDCKDEQSAKDLLLRLNSQYGRMTKESVMEFIGDYEIDTGDLELPGGVLEFYEQSGELEEDTDETNAEPSDFNYQNQYGVIVMCHSEEEQEMVYNKLNSEGYSCKVVCV